MFKKLSVVTGIAIVTMVTAFAVLADIDLGSQGRSTATVTTTPSVILAANVPTNRASTPVSLTFQNVGANACYVWAGNTNDAAAYGYYLPASGGSVTLTPPHIDQRQWIGAAVTGSTTINIIREFPQ